MDYSAGKIMTGKLCGNEGKGNDYWLNVAMDGLDTA